jgi:hypothetical protein
VLSRCKETNTGGNRWFIRFDSSLCPDITVAVRMDPDGVKAHDFYLLPSIDMARGRIRLADTNEWALDAYRCDSLDSLTELSKRVTIRNTYGT